METIRYIIKFFIRLALAFFAIAIVWWIVSLLFPVFSLGTVTSTLTGGDKKDFLPPPRNYGALLGKNKADTAPKVYMPAPAYNGYNMNPYDQSNYSTYDYITYTASGTVVEKGDTSSQVPSRSTYIRNLSLYDGQYIRQGLSFYGEARSEFFQNNQFAILVLNSRNQVIGVMPAYASTQWSVPGWVRFQALMNFPVPDGTCTLLFEQSLPRGSTRRPIMIPYRLNCMQ